MDLIPSWRFFAPVPLTSDYHILYRDRLANGLLTSWTEILSIARPNWWRSCLWNPDRHVTKAVLDLIQMFGTELNVTRRFAKDPDSPLLPYAMRYAISYLTLLNFVSSLSRLYPCQRTQLVALRRDNMGAGSVVFVSEEHPV